MRSAFIAPLLLLLGCNSPTAPTPSAVVLIPLPLGESVQLHWFCPGDPRQLYADHLHGAPVTTGAEPLLQYLARHLEQARARRALETAEPPGAWYNHPETGEGLKIFAMDLGGDHGRARSETSFDIDCAHPAAASHEPGHLWGRVMGLACWRDVWDTVDLTCQ